MLKAVQSIFISTFQRRLYTYRLNYMNGIKVMAAYLEELKK